MKGFKTKNQKRNDVTRLLPTRDLYPFGEILFVCSTSFVRNSFFPTVALFLTNINMSHIPSIPSHHPIFHSYIIPHYYYRQNTFDTTPRQRYLQSQTQLTSTYRPWSVPQTRFSNPNPILVVTRTRVLERVSPDLATNPSGTSVTGNFVHSKSTSKSSNQA